MKKFIKVWLMMASRAAQAQLLNNWTGFLFLIGKIVRFLFFFIFLFSVLTGAGKLLNYSREQVILFFLVFTLIDTISQSIFRGVYWFRNLVVSGDYDFDLLRPMPSFFRPIFGWADIFDFISLFPLIGYMFYFALTSNLAISFENMFIFLFFLLNSLLVSFSFHLLVCGVCIMTTEIDHLVWIYRDLTGVARVPTDIYPLAVRYALTFTIPVVVLMAVPAKALLGLLSWQWMLLAFLIGGVSLLLSFKLWKYALARYSSASS